MSRSIARAEESLLRAFKIGPFRLTSTGLEVEGDPSFAEYESVGDFIERTVKASGWWAADWIAYGESRPDWKDKLVHVVDVDRYSESTVNQYRYLAKNVPPSRRLEGVSFSVHAEVAGLDAADQRLWLQQAKEHGWNQRELRAEIRAARRSRAIRGQARLEGQYRVIYADPPWPAETTPRSRGKNLSFEELAALPVKCHADTNSIVFLWVPAPILLRSPGPRDVLDAWGFEYRTNLVWDAVFGRDDDYAQLTHQHLVIATRGCVLSDVPNSLPKSVQVIRGSLTSPAKPAAFRQLIEKHWTIGPYLELFAQASAPGWTVLGSDPRLWAQEAQGSR